MLKRSFTALIVSALAAGSLSCKIRREEPDQKPAGMAAPTAAQQAAPGASAPIAAGFSVESVPLTTIALPPFPFFKTPEGLVSNLSDKERTINFDAQYFMGGSTPMLVEGKIFRDRFSLTQNRTYSELEFHRNYENAIAALGGRKISTSQYTYEIMDAAGGRAKFDKNNYGASPVPDYRHDSYLIRAPGKEYWIEISTGSFPQHGFVVVLEKQGMAQSVGFLDASAMKSAIDKAGRVALYINFDLDKATLRPDAQPVLDEVNKLLAQSPGLKLSIEGHTDNTGDAKHNRALSASRARSVLGALVGLGIDPARLQSRGFGPESRSPATIRMKAARRTGGWNWSRSRVRTGWRRGAAPQPPERRPLRAEVNLAAVCARCSTFRFRCKDGIFPGRIPKAC